MKHVLSKLLIACVILLQPVSAQTSKRLSDLEMKRKDAMKTIEETSKQLDKNKTTAKNTVYKLNVLTDKIKKRESFLKVLDTELKSIDSEVVQSKTEYEELSRDLNVKKQQYARSLRLMSRKNKSEDKLMFLLSSKNMDQMTRRLRYLSEYSDYQKVQADEISHKQVQVDGKRQELEHSYQEKDAVKSKGVQEANLLKNEKNDKTKLVNSLKSKEKTLSAEIQRQKKLADQLNRQIENIIAEEARKAAAEAAKEKNRTVPTTKGGYAMTVQEKDLSGDFGKLQGRLPYPVSQPGTIVVHYGEQKFQDLKYVENSSKGIDIRTKAGAEALAIYNGIVSKVFALPGYNNSIIVRHGNYLSVYANLSGIHVKAGDKVKTGQSLGRIFVDEAQNNQTILHFQLWKDTQRLNPELWLHK